MRAGVDGQVYPIPIASRIVRVDYENDVLWDRLRRAEKIIVLLRQKVGELESR